MYHKQRYSEVIELLKPLDARIETLSDGLAVHLCVLQLDVHLHRRDMLCAAKALVRLEGCRERLARGFAERKAGPSHGPAEAGGGGADRPRGGARPQSLQLPFLSHSDSGCLSEARRLMANQGRSSPPDPNILALVQFYRGRVHILQRDWMNAGKFIDAVEKAVDALNTMLKAKEAGERKAASAGLAGLGEEVDPMSSLKTTISGSLARIHLGVIRGTEHSSRAARGPDPVVGLKCILADEASLSSDRDKGLRAMLGTHVPDASWFCPRQEGSEDMADLRLVVLNNLGVVHHRRKQHQLASVFFARALCVAGPGGGGTSPSGSPSSPPGTAFQHQAIRYNAGVQHLMLGQYAAALSCFGRCGLGAVPAAEGDKSWSSLLHPMLLIRSVEAVLGLHHKRQSSAAAGRSAATAAEVGLLQQAHVRVAAAVKALLSDMEDVRKEQHRIDAAAEAAGTEKEADQLKVLGYAAQREELQLSELLQSALCKLSYVSLLLNDFENTLSSATSCLMLNAADPSNPIAAACYAAEALNILGRQDEALATMRLVIIAYPEVDEDKAAAGSRKASSSSSSPSARHHLFCNLTSTYLESEKLEEAKIYAANALWERPSRNATLASVYTDMMAGRSDAALSALRNLVKG